MNGRYIELLLELKFIKKCNDCGKVLLFGNIWYHPTLDGCYLCDKCNDKYRDIRDDQYINAVNDAYKNVSKDLMKAIKKSITKEDTE